MYYYFHREQATTLDMSNPHRKSLID